MEVNVRVWTSPKRHQNRSVLAVWSPAPKGFFQLKPTCCGDGLGGSEAARPEPTALRRITLRKLLRMIAGFDSAHHHHIQSLVADAATRNSYTFSSVPSPPLALWHSPNSETKTPK